LGVFGFVVVGGVSVVVGVDSGDLDSGKEE
jgi:hypothetical protein